MAIQSEKIAASVTAVGHSSSPLKVKIQWLITLGIPIALAFVPTTAVFTKPISLFLSITLWAMFSWMFSLVPETVVGFILPILYIVAGVATPNDAFSPWLSNVPWVCFGGVVMGHIMLNTGLAKRIAYKAILVTGGTYKRTLVGILLGGLIMAPLIPSIMAKISIFSVIGIAICQALNLKPKSRAAAGVMMTSFIAVSGPKLSYLTGAADNTLAMGLVAKVTGTMITWGEFALHNAIIGIIYSFISLLIVFIVLKPETEFDSVDVMKAHYKELGPISFEEKKAAIMILATFILMATDSLHHIDVGWILMMLAAITFFPKVGLFQSEQLSKMNFSMLFFICGAMSIGAVAAKVGVVKLAANALLPLLQGNQLYTFISVYFFGVIMKFFLTPLAATSMFMTTIAETAVKLGLHPYSLVYVFKYGIDQYVFPYEYAVLLYIYSFGYISLNHIFKVMIPRIFTTAVFLAVVAYPYWKLCGLFN